MPCLIYDHIVLSARAYAGAAYIAGEAPADSGDPESPDGRFRRVNVPSRGRVVLFERGTYVCVASTLSETNGTWRFDYLKPDVHYTVIGYDDRGEQNAAIQDWILPVPMA